MSRVTPARAVLLVSSHLIGAHSFGIFGGEVSLIMDNRYSFSFTILDFTVELFGARMVFIAGGSRKIDLQVCCGHLMYFVWPVWP